MNIPVVVTGCMPKKDLKSKEMYENKDFLDTLIRTLEQGNETFTFLQDDKKENYQIEVFNNVSAIPEISEDLLAFELTMKNNCIKLKHLKEIKTNSNQDEKMKKNEVKRKNTVESPRKVEETMNLINLKEIVAFLNVKQDEALVSTDNIISENNQRDLVGFLANEQPEILKNPGNKNVQIESSDISEALQRMENKNRDQTEDFLIVNNEDEKKDTSVVDKISSSFILRNEDEECFISNEMTSLKRKLSDSQVNIEIKSVENGIKIKLNPDKNTSENIVIHIKIPVKSEIEVVLPRVEGELKENTSIPHQVLKGDSGYEKTDIQDVNEFPIISIPHQVLKGDSGYEKTDIQDVNEFPIISIPHQVLKGDSGYEKTDIQDVNELPTYNPTPTINSVIYDKKANDENIKSTAVSSTDSTPNPVSTAGRVKELIYFFENMCNDQ
ncbi:hypothetical protein GINT2_000687 [Glugoides intestinalis]